MYSEIDINPLFNGYTANEDRSIMNATFNLKNESLKDKFDKMWKEAGIIGLNGHRSVGVTGLQCTMPFPWKVYRFW